MPMERAQFVKVASAALEHIDEGLAARPELQELDKVAKWGRG